MPERPPAGTSPKVYTTIELVVMPAACRRNDLSLQSTSPLPTTPDVAARRTSVSPVRVITAPRFHIERTPACSLLHRRLLHRTLAAPPHYPSDRPLHPIAPSTSDESTALCLPARVPWDASDSGGFGSVVNAN
ncbi:hypothetical protein B0H14DRAFT_3454943 [Mycena olivaceomarginata]|nr:hypothetical protein B0H14DRAFT_3454943 [Mycena olivaceomarginata]